MIGVGFYGQTNIKWIILSFFAEYFNNKCKSYYGKHVKSEFQTYCSQVSNLISKIQQAYVETLEELNWMDDASKEKAREKVHEQENT